MKIKDYNNKLCSFKFYGHRYVNILIKINENYVDLVCKTECIDNISYMEFEDLIINNLFGYEDFKLNEETTINNTMKDLSLYNNKLCSYIFDNQTYNRKILLRDSYVMFETYGLHNIGGHGLTYDEFAKVLKDESRMYKNFKLINNMEIKDYDGKLCSFKYDNKEYSNILVKIISNSIWFINDGCKNHIRRGIPIERFEKIVSGIDDVFTNFKLNCIDNTMERNDLKKYNKKLCRIALFSGSEINGVIYVNGDNIMITNFCGDSLIKMCGSDFIKVIKEPMIGVRKFYIVEDDDMDVNKIFENFNNKICTCQIDGTKMELKIVIDRGINKIFFKMDKFELCLKNVETTMNFLLKNNRTYDSKILDFKLNEEIIKNNIMGKIKYNNHICSFNYMNDYFDNVKIIYRGDYEVDLYYKNELFTRLASSTFEELAVNNAGHYSHLKSFTNFRLINNEDKKELTTVRDYYNKYNARLCCFNNGNGTKKYRINVSLYNDSVYLNSNLNEIKYNESLCRKIDIHTFDYLLKNGKLLNKVITDFKILESEKKKITMKEISEKFNIHVNDIEIVK